MRLWAVLAAVAAIGLCGASQASPGATDGVGKPEQANGKGASAQAKQPAANPPPATPKPAAPANKQSAKANEPARQSRTIGERIWRWTFRLGRDPIAVLTLLLFVLGGAQVEISRRTARRQLRAYIVVEIGGLRGVAEGQEPVGLINIYNVGQTPAYNVTSDARVMCAIYGRDKSVSVPGGKDIKVLKDLTLGPGKSVTLNSQLRLALPPEFMKSLEEKKGAIFVVGCVAYRDIFKRRHATQFCHRYPGPDFTVKGGEYYDAGNKAT